MTDLSSQQLVSVILRSLNETAKQFSKGSTMRKKRHIGSSFSNFLKTEGICEDVTAHAIKRVLAWQIAQAMKKQCITKVEMAKRMKTSHAQLDRLLDPKNDKVQLDTVQRAAAAVGRKLHMELA